MGYGFCCFSGGCGRNNFSGVVGGWVVGSIVFLVVMAATIFLVVVIYLFYKVVLVDVDLCRWWLSALLQQRWLCRCC